MRPSLKHLALAAIFASLTASAQPPRSRIGGIDLFGYGGLPAERIQHALEPLRNKPLRSAADARSIRDLAAAIALRESGVPATDIALVCCEPDGETHLFVGLRGTSERALQHATAPGASVRLPGEGLQLYRREARAVEQAVKQGQAGEDRSMGFPLSDNAAARSAQHDMRAYAIHHSNEIRTVLLTAADTNQRRAAAALLGYAIRTREQIAALAGATDDADDEVRNNAARALAVMASAGPLDTFDPGPVIALLYSGEWTDRNKAAFLLSELTTRRDRRLLDALHREAMSPLLEGARWHSPGHAFAFLQILGRIAGMSDVEITRAIQQHDAAEIITAVTR